MVTLTYIDSLAASSYYKVKDKLKRKSELWTTKIIMNRHSLIL